MGDRNRLKEVIEEHKSVYWEDKTYFLMCRLHHLVMQEGIRKIALVYARISLDEIEEVFKIPRNIFEKYVHENRIRGII